MLWHSSCKSLLTKTCLKLVFIAFSLHKHISSIRNAQQQNRLAKITIKPNVNKLLSFCVY